MRPVRVISILTIVALLGAESSALAQSATSRRGTGTTAPQPEATPAPSATNGHDDEAARLLFNTAREAFGAGNYPVALERFQQAYDLSHRPELLYNIGTTLDRMRRDRDALTAFDRFLAESDPSSANRTEVEARVRVLREAVELEDRRRVEAEAEQARRQASLEEARRDAEARAEASRLEAERARAEQNRGMTPIVFWSLAGAAVAVGGAGIGLGIRTRHLDDDYEALADAHANVGEIQSAYDKAHTSQTVTNVLLFSSAGLAVGATVVAFFTRWHKPSDAPARPASATTASASPTRGGLVLGLQHRF